MTASGRRATRLLAATVLLLASIPLLSGTAFAGRSKGDGGRGGIPKPGCEVLVDLRQLGGGQIATKLPIGGQGQDLQALAQQTLAKLEQLASQNGGLGNVDVVEVTDVTRVNNHEIKVTIRVTKDGQDRDVVVRVRGTCVSNASATSTTKAPKGKGTHPGKGDKGHKGGKKHKKKPHKTTTTRPGEQQTTTTAGQVGTTTTTTQAGQETTTTADTTTTTTTGVASGGDSLPFTGSNPVPLLIAAVVMLLVGVPMVLVSRRASGERS